MAAYSNLPHRLRRLFPIFLTGVGIAALTLALFLAQPKVLTQISLNIYDLLLTRRVASAQHPPSPIPVIVDLDEASLKLHGQWPWPRHRLAVLLEKLSLSGAAVIAMDILISEPDRTSPAAVVRALREELGVDAALTGLPEQLYDNDTLLARVVSKHPVILGGFVRFDDNGEHTLDIPAVPHVERISPGGVPAASHLIRGRGMTPLVPVLQSAGPVAFFNMVPDQDGLIRRIPLLALAGNGDGKTEDKLYANLSLRALMRATGTKTLRLNSGPVGLESLSLGKLTIPVSPEGFMLVPFPGPARSFPYISAADVLRQDFDPQRVRGRMVFLGTSAVGLQDIRSTPLERYLPGVEVHAGMVNAAVNNSHIVLPPWESALQAMTIAGCGLLGLLLFSVLPPVPAMCGSVALAGGLFGLSAYWFNDGIFFSPVWGMFTLVVQGTGLMLQRMWTTERDKRRLRNVFSRYVSPEVVRRIVDRGETVLRGEERELTIMFTDLRNFTTMSEGLTPQQVVSLLNRYFTPMTGLIRAAEGTLDKFIGDAIMAFWNAPLDVNQHPQRAVHTALAMLRELDTLNATLAPELGVTLRMGAGIHSGMAYVGNMGSEELTSYTAIGDAVNLASRLEGLCSRFGMTLILSGETASHCTEGVHLLPLARLRVKGRATPVEIHTAFLPETYALRAPELTAFTTARALYVEAINTHSASTMTVAHDAFQTLNNTTPLPLYAEYATFCTQSLTTPSADWSDIWTLTSK